MLAILRNLFRDDTDDKDIDPALAAAALLFEVAWADHSISDDELETVRLLMRKQFDVDPQRLEEIISETRELHDQSVGVFPFTRAINEQLDQAAKVSIIRAMWQIAFADDNLDVFEEHTIRRIADLLYVPHREFIAAKLAARPRPS